MGTLEQPVDLIHMLLDCGRENMQTPHRKAPLIDQGTEPRIGNSANHCTTTPPHMDLYFSRPKKKLAAGQWFGALY